MISVILLDLFSGLVFHNLFQFDLSIVSVLMTSQTVSVPPYLSLNLLV